MPPHPVWVERKSGQQRLSGLQRQHDVRQPIEICAPIRRIAEGTQHEFADTPFEMCSEQADERLAANRKNLREIAVGTPLSNRFDRSCRWFGPSIRNADAEML